MWCPVVVSKQAFVQETGGFHRNCFLRTTGATSERGCLNNHQHGVLLFGRPAMSAQNCAAFYARDHFLEAKSGSWQRRRNVRKGKTSK